MPRSTTYLLDTNIIVMLVRGKSVGLQLASTFGLGLPLNLSVVSIVTVGEILALSRKWSWGVNRITQLNQLLSTLIRADIHQQEVLEAYAMIDEYSERSGRSLDKNDLWIAAIAHARSYPLLTCDGDFDHLHPTYLNRIRIDPKTGLEFP